MIVIKKGDRSLPGTDVARASKFTSFGKEDELKPRRLL